MEYISVAQAAEKWGITKRRVQKYCIDGRIDGAVRFSTLWAIPQDAPKPTDPRKKKEDINEA